MNADPAPIELAHVAPFRLGPIEARPATREIIAGGEREVLQPRIMQVLVALARQAGEVVSRDDLIAACWDGQEVGNDAIQRCVAKLRQVGVAHGAFSIENIARVGYRLNTTPEQAPAIKAASQESPPLVLVVLPFENLSSDPELQFFSDGVSEDILTSVARTAGLRVIGSTSSVSFRGAHKGEAARALNASHVLDGSVRRAGARVRIALQLTEAATGCVLWSERYDRELADALALQDEIAAATAQTLSTRLAPLTPRPQLDPHAYELYLRALTIRKTPDPWAQEKAIAYFREALAIEPAFARARAALALALCKNIQDATIYGAPPGAFGDAVARVRVEAERALALDCAAPEARFALASLEPSIGNWEAQEENMRAALAIAPNDGTLAIGLGRILLASGRARDAAAQIGIAYRNDPLSPLLMAHESWRRLVLGDVANARALARRAFEAAPADAFIWRGYMGFLELIRDWEEFGRVQADVFERVGVSAAGMARGRAYLATLKGDPSTDVDFYLRDSLAFAREAPFGVFSIVFQFAVTGYVDRAFDLVDEAMAIHPPHKLWSQWCIDTMNTSGSGMFFLSPPALRAHPRFLPLCAKIGLCAYWTRTGRWPDFIVDAKNRCELEAEVRRLAADPQFSPESHP